MKSKIVWFAIIFTLVNQLFSQQNKIVVSKNKHQFFNQTVTFNPTVEKYFRVMECSQSNAYSADQINKIQLRLKQNFSESTKCLTCVLKLFCYHLDLLRTVQRLWVNLFRTNSVQF